MPPETTGPAEPGFVGLRYKDPGQSPSKLIETPITRSTDANP